MCPAEPDDPGGDDGNTETTTKSSPARVSTTPSANKATTDPRSQYDKGNAHTNIYLINNAKNTLKIT